MLIRSLKWLLSHDNPAVIASYIKLLTGVVNGGQAHIHLLMQGDLIEQLVHKIQGEVQIINRVMSFLNGIFCKDTENQITYQIATQHNLLDRLPMLLTFKNKNIKIEAVKMVGYIAASGQQAAALLANQGPDLLARLTFLFTETNDVVVQKEV
jgi:hypothetical protein